MKRRAGQKKSPLVPAAVSVVFPLLCAVLAACSFDYGEGDNPENTKPDIIMENIDYVRVRDSDPTARFQAEYAERWEENQTMKLENLTFEQMEDRGETVNASGKAGSAVVQLDSGDIALNGGVNINIESEDVSISTGGLEWKDKEKTLTGDEGAEVDIGRSDGTSFSGRGFSADIRNRTWDFSGEVKGSYVEEDEEEESAEPAGDGSGETGTGPEKSAGTEPAATASGETGLPAGP